MPALDAAGHIGEALTSIGRALAGQDDVEVVLADGGSRDRTREIAAGFDFVRVLEGGDDSLYAGFNRGVAASRGSILGFVCADDLILDGALRAVRDAFATAPQASMVTGDVLSGRSLRDCERMEQKVPLSVEGALFGIPAMSTTEQNQATRAE